MEEKQKYLHGTLEVTIFHATPYIPPFPFKCILKGSPAYVTIKINNKRIAKTTQEHDRVWNQTFQIPCAHSAAATTVTITLKTKYSVLGKTQITANQILNESALINGFFPLNSDAGKPNPRLKLRFVLWFRPAALEQGWGKVIGNGAFNGLKNATFGQRSNNEVVLYHDAHHSTAFRPPFESCGSRRHLWEDVYKAIEGARHLVYIAGWSLNPHLALVRDLATEIPHARGVKIGELLKRKAEEGVTVRIMLWDDETSLPVLKNRGLMRTHDEDAAAYFRHTKVICRLCPRLHRRFPTAFAHHQKTITVDVRSRSSQGREIMSFVGGVDLCDGRYDTEEHSLFKTLNTHSHFEDFYQTSIAGASLRHGGPREPWHDAHACVTGEAAGDILANFEQRWTKQCDGSLLLPVNSIPELSRQPISGDSSPQNDWKVQVLRSIDHVSTTHLPVNSTTEQSIHDAYVEAIRRAERFIYIENQYFIGGCHLWEQDQNSGSRNLIPVEIALKIASKIRAKERFAVYILIPMWPEGSPESEIVREMLHWTRETMKMMYRLIGEALEESRETGDDHHHYHPLDYLNFFCLANREKKLKGELIPPHFPHPETEYWKAQNHRRFMVYVHSKIIIVDDTYMLIGSANVNQRSMDGKRDTEIAIGCYETRKDEEDIAVNDGEIHAYRMSLWYEHTRRAEASFLEPHSLECIRTIRSIGETMWKIYCGDEVVDMGGVHLVTYPVIVTENGCVKDHEDGFVHFPDTKTPVKGSRSKVLPPILTT